MRHMLFASLVAAAAATLSLQASAGEVFRVIPAGKDGDNLYYRVVCKNETAATVILRDSDGVYCAHPFGGTQICDKSWTLREAAERACG